MQLRAFDLVVFVDRCDIDDVTTYENACESSVRYSLARDSYRVLFCLA